MNIEEQIINLKDENLGKTIFTISSYSGENNSEAQLIKLVKKSCLSLWGIWNGRSC